MAEPVTTVADLIEMLQSYPKDDRVLLEIGTDAAVIQDDVLHIREELDRKAVIISSEIG